MTDATTRPQERWLTPGVRGIGAASLLSDLGHEVPTALLPSLLTTTLGATASALGLIEGGGRRARRGGPPRWLRAWPSVGDVGGWCLRPGRSRRRFGRWSVG